MSTTFGIEYGDEVIEIARRMGTGNGKVAIIWRNDLYRKLAPDTPVIPLDNTYQGVETIFDLLVLERYGSLKLQVEQYEVQS